LKDWRGRREEVLKGRWVLRVEVRKGGSFERWKNGGL
jgi:hypothetical protein